jgi:hypothetical protein
VTSCTSAPSQPLASCADAVPAISSVNMRADRHTRARMRAPADREACQRWPSCRPQRGVHMGRKPKLTELQRRVAPSGSPRVRAPGPSPGSGAWLTPPWRGSSHRRGRGLRRRSSATAIVNTTDRELNAVGIPGLTKEQSKLLCSHT